jgi:hypothetical protein
VPDQDAARRQWLAEQTRARLARRAERYRELLMQACGVERGRAVQAVEAFEACEYGAPLDGAARGRLFPFVL